MKIFEVIVVDSSNDSVVHTMKERFPWVRVYGFPQRKYCGDARNFGISVAKGEIIAFLDADCWADPGWVKEILKAHDQDFPWREEPWLMGLLTAQWAGQPIFASSASGCRMVKPA
jgi:glycosyltransferase involved in cell wall biosynthesis